MAASSTHSATSFSVVPQARATACIAASGSTVCAMARALRIGSFIGVSGAVNGRVASRENPRSPARLSSSRRSEPQPIDDEPCARPCATSCSSCGSNDPGGSRAGAGRLVSTTVRMRRSRGECDSERCTSSMPDSPSTSEWWTLMKTANRFRASPSMTYTCQPGRSRIEHRRVQLGDEFVQLRVGAGRRQRPLLHVPVHVECCRTSRHSGRPTRAARERG